MRLRPLRWSLVFALVLSVVLTCRVAFADELQLTNGDRYSGTVVTLDGGLLKFDTGRGTLDVPWPDVVGATIDMPIVVTVAGMAPRTVVYMAVGDGQVELYPGGVVASSDVVRLARPAGGATLTGGANAGFLATGGNTDATSLRVDIEGVMRVRQNRYTVSGAVNRAAERDVETTHNATVSGRYDRFVSPRLYTNANAMLTTDQFRDLDLRTALGLGLGYQVADNALIRLGIEAGYGYVNRRFKIAPDDSYHAARETASLDVFVIGKRLVLFHRHDGFFGLKGNDKLFVQTRNGIRIGLIGGLVTTLEWDIDYDLSPSPGSQQTDRTFNVTFGYRF